MQKCKKLYRGLDMRILTCYNNIIHPGIAKLVSRLVWDQETVRSSRTTRTNEKRDSEIADFRVPFPCSMSTVMLDLNPSNSTGLERRLVRMRLPCLQRNGSKRLEPSESFLKRGAMVEHLHKRISHLNLPRGFQPSSNCILSRIISG